MGERRGEVREVCWWGNLKEGDFLAYLGVGERITLKCILKKLGDRPWTGLILLRIGT